MARIRSAKRQTLGDIIYEQLRDRIVGLQIVPGQMLFENAVSTEFGVSRTPVREAFARLEQEELIEIEPQRGARVTKLSIRKTREAQELREILELAAFTKAAEMWENGEPHFDSISDRIEILISEQLRTARGGDYVAFARLDSAYHDEIILAIDNVTLANVVKQVGWHLRRLRFVELEELRHYEPAIQDHIDIFAAVRRNDVSTVKSRLTQHLRGLDDVRDRIFAKHSDLFGWD